MGNTQPLQQILLGCARAAMARSGVPRRARVLLDEPSGVATLRITCAGRVCDTDLRTLGDLAGLHEQIRRCDLG